MGYDNLCFKPGVCPRVDFDFTPACAGMPVTFTDTSTGGSPPYSWSFGDGTTSTSKDVTHTFVGNSSTFQVTHCVSGGSQPPLCVTKTVPVKPKPAAPVINGPIQACNSPATYCVNPSNPALAYQWTVVGGGTVTGSANGACVQVSWPSPGLGGGLVSVTATNEAGCSSSSQIEIQSCTEWLADCCRCGELSVKDEKLLGSTFTASVTDSAPVTRVAVDLISTWVVPFGWKCGSPGPRESHVNGGSLGPPTFTTTFPAVPAPREILFNGGPVSLAATPLSLSLALPAPPPSFWCGDYLSFCLKYSFTGRDCTTCELIECYGPYKRGGIKIYWPVDVVVGKSFGLVVELPDAEGLVNRDAGVKLFLGIKPGTGTTGARLRGRTHAPLLRGKAEFSGLSLNRPGDGYVLTLALEAGGEALAESEPFTVRPRP